jgi:long-chain acyl-CoA synthetase
MRMTEAGRPWLAVYPRGIDWHMSLPEQPLPHLLRDSVSRFADRPCLDFFGRRWSYRAVGDLVSRAAKGFRALGVDKGVRVALVLPNSPYYVIAYYAVLEAGGTVININPLYATAEISHLLTDAAAEIAVTIDLDAIYGKVAALVGSGSLRKIVVCRLGAVLPCVKRLAYAVLHRRETARAPRDDAHVDFAALVDNDGIFTPPPIDVRRDVAVLQYTGGTTGTPKGAMLTHYNLVANALQCLRWFPESVPGEERVLAVLPFFHVFAMTVVLNVSIAEAAEITLLPRFEIGALFSALRRKRPTALAGVPTLFTAMSSNAAQHGVDLTSIKSCISGGAPLPVEVKSRFEALTSCTLIEGYGLTEASPVVACNPHGGLNKPGSVGLPLPGTEIRIVALDDPGREVAPGERGEVLVRGAQVMAGYWEKPEASAEVLRDGWLRTGDVGYFDGDGYLFLVDRIKDIIIAGGYNIYPRVVEDAIYQHAKVAECVVVGVPDAYRGQTVKAYIAPAAGERLDEREILAFLKDKLSPIEMPRLIEFRDSLPKTLIGKASRKALLEEEARRAARPS